MEVLRFYPVRILHSFAVQAYSQYKGLFYWLTWQGYTANVVIRPIVGVILFAVLARVIFSEQEAQNLALGVAVSSMIFLLLGGISQSFVNERSLGTIQFLFSSPANRFSNFLSRSALHYPTAILSFVFGLFGGWLIVGLDFQNVNWPAFTIGVLVTTAAITAFCQFMGVISIVVREWSQSLDLTSGTLTLLSGVIIPLSVFPSFVGEFARFLPITNGLEAMRASFFSGETLSEVSALVAREALNGLMFLVVGYIAFTVFERIAKRIGSLEMEAF